MEIEVAIFNRQNKIPPPADKIVEEVVNFTIQHIKNKPAKIKKINIIFVDNNKIAKLNLQFLDKDCPTDVLVFNTNGEADIFVSLEQCSINAKIYKEKEKNEILRVIIHGILHSFGYDDKTKNKYNEMWQLQENILNSYLNKAKF
jgi:rRNA maturation RNase YbeY